MLPIWITHLGTATPLGTRTEMSTSVYYLGFRMHEKHSYLVDLQGEPFTISKADYLDPDALHTERLFLLMQQALQKMPVISGVPYFIALPENQSELSTFPPNLEEQLMEKIFQKFPNMKDQCTWIRGGNSIGFEMLKKAITSMNENKLDACILGGVDSYFDPDIIYWLEETNQTLTSTNPNGMIPSEGAAFYLLTTETKAKKECWKPLAKVRGVGTGLEPNPYTSHAVCNAQGLKQAIKTACKNNLANNQKICQIYCDLNAERERANEFGFLMPTLQNFIQQDAQIEMPAGHWGDLGATTSLALINLAISSYQLKYNSNQQALIWCSSRNEHRGAVLLECIQSE